jgi:hypothetical protein
MQFDPVALWDNRAMPARSSTAPYDNHFTRVKRLVDAADIEGFLRAGAPHDEYDRESSLISGGVRSMDLLSIESVEALIFEFWATQFGPSVSERKADYQQAFHSLAVAIVENERAPLS